MEDFSPNSLRLASYKQLKTSFYGKCMATLITGVTACTAYYSSWVEFPLFVTTVLYVINVDFP